MMRYNLRNDENIERYMLDGKCEKTVIECNKWRSLIKIVVGGNITIL